jgi:hypothetical protein
VNRSRKIAFLPSVLAALAVVACLRVASNRSAAEAGAASDESAPLEALITGPDAVTEEQIAEWKTEGFKAVVLVLDERFKPEVYQKAAKAVLASSLDLYYWIEVGRNPALADEHPEWMASLGMHNDWRKLFPDVRELEDGEVAKAWPWTSIGYREAFDAHLARITVLLERAPATYRGLVVNDLQGGPSSCGCGNLQCRWAIDYGVPSTATKLDGNEIAGKFLAEVQKLAAGKQVIPIWAIECELEDMALEKRAGAGWSTGYCGEVDCFNYCRRMFTEQWQALHAIHRGPTGILALHKEFHRDRQEYGAAANWIRHAVQYLDQLKPAARPRQQLWLVVQGYDVTPEEEHTARHAGLQSGAGAILVARTRIDQSYVPRIIPVASE